MKVQKTWSTVTFSKASIELTMNYKTEKYTMTHDGNNDFITFNSEGSSLRLHLDRLACVKAALKYVKDELQ